MLFKTLQASGNLVELLETYRIAPPLGVVHGTCARRIDAGFTDGVGDQTHAGHMDTIAQFQMPGDTDPAPQQAVSADP